MSTFSPEAVAAVRAQLDDWVARSIELRSISLPAANAGPQAFHEARVQARASLDQLEEILSQAMALRGMLRRAHQDLSDAADDAWDDISHRRNVSGRVDQYSAGRERVAECNLATRVQRAEVREIARLLDSANEALERLWLKYRGLSATKYDLVQELKYHDYETYLER
jgi:hypothetical protein